MVVVDRNSLGGESDISVTYSTFVRGQAAPYAGERQTTGRALAKDLVRMFFQSANGHARSPRDRFMAMHVLRVGHRCPRELLASMKAHPEFTRHHPKRLTERALELTLRRRVAQLKALVKAMGVRAQCSRGLVTGMVREAFEFDTVELALLANLCALTSLEPDRDAAAIEDTATQMSLSCEDRMLVHILDAIAAAYRNQLTGRNQALVFNRCRRFMEIVLSSLLISPEGVCFLLDVYFTFLGGRFSNCPPRDYLSNQPVANPTLMNAW